MKGFLRKMSELLRCANEKRSEGSNLEKEPNCAQGKRQTFSRYIKSKLHIRAAIIGVPYAWCVVFFLAPAILIFQISLTRGVLGIPPFTSIIQKFDNYFYNFSIYIGNYVTLFTDSFYFSAVLSSFILSCATTICCLIIGYLMAYSINLAPKRMHIVLVLMVILPFATSFLIRIYSLMSLLNTRGIVNTLLEMTGIISKPLHFLDNNFAVCLGMVYCYLPFMILPIYATLTKIDETYIEASLDLGASYWRSFWSITFPLSLPGVFAGCTLVFVPSLGEFVIPELLGGAKTMTIGQAIWCEFFNNRDWPLACAIAVFMMFSFAFYILLSRIKGSFIKGNKKNL